MNDQQIYSLMLKTPNIRAVQIADALDQPLAKASEALRSMVESGDVLQSKGVAPNNVPCMVYSVSDDGRLSSDYRAAYAASLRDVAVVVPVAAPAPVPVPAVAVAPATPPAPAVGTRVDRAIAFIRQKGSATNAELRAAMGLLATQSPSQFLKPAIENGRIVYVDFVWSLGDGKPSVVPVDTPAAAPAGPAPAGPAPAAPAAAPAGPAPAAAPAAPAPAPAAAQPVVKPVPTTPAAAPVFRCGLWSDGVLELQRDGITIHRLSHQDGEQMASVILRMLRDPLDLIMHASAQQP